MNDQQAITRSEAWYFQRYHAGAHGPLTWMREGQELRDAQVLCVDRVPERGTTVVNVAG